MAAKPLPNNLQPDQSGLRPIRPDLDPNTLQLGKYRILGEVGRGGMADVYLACAHGPSGFNKLVVVKAIRSEIADDAESREMFFNEARLAGKLNHPNVVHTMEVGEDSGRPMLVMEYLDGQSLHTVINRCRRNDEDMPVPLALRVLSEALQGLHYAHTTNDFDGTPLQLVHRDVSPQNIFVTYDGQIKVLDFGIAKAAISSAETRAGLMKGKAAYMAPEQISGGAIDHRADLFAAGVVMWQVLTGQQWWKGKPQGRILLTVLNGEVPKPSDVRDDVDPALEAICLKAMAIDVDKRFQTALEMHDALESVLDAYPRVSARDVGTFVAKLFEEEREKRGRALETEMRTLSNASLSLATVSASQLVHDFQESFTGVENPEAQPNPNQSKKRTGLYIALLAIPIVLIGALGWMKMNSSTEPEASSVATPMESSPPVTPTPPLVEETAKPVASCTFTIAASPDDATISINGSALSGNPATTQVPGDGKVYKIQAEASGFVTRTVEITAIRDATFSLDLEPVRRGGRAVPVAPRAVPKADSTPEVPSTPPPAATPEPSKKEEPKSARDRIKELDTSTPW